jgi:hypothetical protein
VEFLHMNTSSRPGSLFVVEVLHVITSSRHGSLPSVKTFM